MKKGNFYTVMGLLLITAALLLSSYNLWDNCRAGKATDTALEQLTSLIKEVPVTVSISKEPEPEFSTTTDSTYEVQTEEAEYPDYILNPQIDMPVKNVDGADYIGIISIPAINRELPVFSEWNYPNLNNCPCRYAGSAYLDDLVICAHNRDVHFGSLKYLNYHDTITFTDVDGNVFSYNVIEIETLQPTAINEMTTGDWDLTLFTCTIGGASRVTVRCQKTDS